MNEKELQEIIQENKSNFKIIIEDNIFEVNEISIFKTDNPLSEPTTRGGVYFAEMKELKVEATVQNMDVTKHLSKAMLGPNKDFLDIELNAVLGKNKRISLITNLTNSMQNASKVILYLTIKDAILSS